MKKIIYFTAAAALLAGCTNDMATDNPAGQQPTHVVFEGGFDDTATRTAFTDESGGKYQLTWSRNDAIGIFTLNGNTSNINQRANLLRTSEGQSNGVFIPVEDGLDLLELPSSGSDEFLIYYPFAEGTDIDVDDFVIYSYIAANQTQEELSDKQVGKNGFSYGKATVTGEDQKINFSLTHTMAYIRFVVSTSEYTSYALSAVQLFDKNGNAALSGDFAFNPFNATLSPVSGKTNSSARVSVEDGTFNAIGNGTAELYLTVLPGNLSAADLYAVVTFSDRDGATVNIPVAVTKKGNLPAGSMTTIELAGVSSSSNAFAWYEPNEKRTMVDGWCYGPQNTYHIVQPTASGTYGDIRIEVKARGDFSRVKEPVYYGLISSGEGNGRGPVVLPNGSRLYESVPTTRVNSDYTIDFKIEDQTKSTGSWGVVAIYDGDYNVLWSYMIWVYSPDDVPGDIEYPNTGISIMDRNLGARYSHTVENITRRSNPGAYFQWGRPTPFQWSNADQNHYDKRWVDADTDLAYVLAHPYILFAGTSGDDFDSRGDWKVDFHRPDLWGATNNTSSWYDPASAGNKTIFDPCPEGYRVASGQLIDYVLTRAEKFEDESIIANQYYLRYPLGGDKYDYWTYSGAHWGSNNSWGNRTSSQRTHGYLYWSDTTDGEDPMRGSCLQGCYFSSGWGESTSAIRSQGFTVRCMKDERGR